MSHQEDTTPVDHDPSGDDFAAMRKAIGESMKEALERWEEGGGFDRWASSRTHEVKTIARDSELRRAERLLNEAQLHLDDVTEKERGKEFVRSMDAGDTVRSDPRFW